MTAKNLATLRQLAPLARIHDPMMGDASRSLYAHQKQAVKWALTQLETTDLKGVLLAMDMGTGKTVTSLVVARAYQALYSARVMIVCPASLKDNWYREAAMVGGVEIEVYSWAKMPDRPKRNEVYVMIFDEAHYLQSGRNSQRGKDGLSLARSARASILLSGTPMPNGKPINLQPLLAVCGHSIATPKRNYEIRYCDAKATAFSKWDVSGASNLGELHALTKDYCILRIKKEECLDLPPLIRKFQPVEVKGYLLSQWQETVRLAKQEYLEQKDDMNPAAAMVMYGRLRKAASLIKMFDAVELAIKSVAEDNSIVLFTKYVDTAKGLRDLLLDSNIEVCLLTGETPVPQRQSLVDCFQTGKVKVFISTIGAGGTGLTLTRSQTVVMVDRDYRPGDNEQAEARCHRIGTKGNVYSIWLQFAPVDERGDAMLSGKEGNIKQAIDGTIVIKEGLLEKLLC